MSSVTFVNGLYIQTSLAVNCLPETSDRYYHTYVQKWWFGKLFTKKFFFVIFTSGRFCLTHKSVGVGLHFQEAPGRSGRVRMYAKMLRKQWEYAFLANLKHVSSIRNTLWMTVNAYEHLLRRDIASFVLTRRKTKINQSKLTNVLWSPCDHCELALNCIRKPNHNYIHLGVRAA